MSKKQEITPLRKLQLAELEALKEFVRICKKNKLTYYISGGTYLGAVRHKGFIPWDDDMDVAMPRADFEKFLKISNEISDDFKLVTFKNEKSYNWYPPKLQNNKVKIVNKSAKNSRIEGAWIDIFPLDGMPKSLLLRKIHEFRLLSLRALYKLSDYDNIVDTREKKRPFYEKPFIFIGKNFNIFKFLDTKKMLYRIDKALKKYSAEKSETYMNFMGSYKLKSVISKHIYADGAYYDFEGMKLFGPKDYDTYLTIIYGDYMTPPKKNAQNKHNTEVL